MRKEILPEMFNYNKYPGPDFVYVADLLKSCSSMIISLGTGPMISFALRDFTRTSALIRVKQTALADCRSICVNTVLLVAPTLF